MSVRVDLAADPSEVERWQTKYQAEYHRAHLEATIRRAAREAEAAYRNKHPQAGALRTKSDIYVYRKPPKGFYRYRVEIVQTMLESRSAREEPNSAFIARMNNRFTPHVAPANFLTRPLPRIAIKQIEELLRRKGVWLDLRKHNTLSKIKLALRAKMEAPSSARDYVLPISFRADAIVVGDAMLSVYKHEAGYSRVRVGKQWLRCDVLEELVRKGTD